MKDLCPESGKVSGSSSPLIAIFGVIHRPQAGENLVRLIDAFERYGFEVTLEDPLYQSLCERGLFTESRRTFSGNTPKDTAFAISFGGDGTFLNSLHRLASPELPILPINSGHLGFLTDVNPGEAIDMVPRLLQGDYCIEDRILLALYNQAGELLGNAFNEVAVERAKSGSLLSVDAWINGDFLAKYQGNGLLVATPSGSTAYSLSLNGPIIDPRSKVLVLTPIAPHTLNLRPMVVPDQVIVTLRVEARDPSFEVTVDGYAMILPVSEQITIRRSKNKVRILKLSHHSFADVVRSKLLWGETMRSR